MLFYLVFCFLTFTNFCIEVQSLQNAENTSSLERLNIGFLWNKKNFQNAVFSAFEIGIRNIKHKVHGYDIHYSMEDSSCNPKMGMKAVLKLKEKFHQLDGIIGPQCSVACEPVGLYAAALNVPLVSVRCLSNKLSDKKTYPTFTTARGYSKYRSVVVLSLFRKLGWTTFSIATTDVPLFKQEAKLQQKLSEEHGMDVQLYTFSSTVPGVNVDHEKLSTLRVLLHGMKEKSRVTLMYMYDEDIRNFLILAKFEGLLCEDHMFIGFVPAYRGTMIAAKYIMPDLRDSVVYQGVIAVSEDYATETAMWNEFDSEMALSLSMKNYSQNQIKTTLRKAEPHSGERKKI